MFIWTVREVTASNVRSLGVDIIAKPEGPQAANIVGLPRRFVNGNNSRTADHSEAARFALHLLRMRLHVEEVPLALAESLKAEPLRDSGE